MPYRPPRICSSTRRLVGDDTTRRPVPWRRGADRQPSPLSPLRSVVDTGTEDVEQRIRALVADRSLDIHFQPIVDLETGRNLGVEALARFPGDPDRTPARWFADASSVGLRTALERAALELALEQIPRLPEGMYLSINLSAESLLSRRVREALADGAG